MFLWDSYIWPVAGVIEVGHPHHKYSWFFRICVPVIGPSWPTSSAPVTVALAAALECGMFGLWDKCSWNAAPPFKLFATTVVGTCAWLVWTCVRLQLHECLCEGGRVVQDCWALMKYSSHPIEKLKTLSEWKQSAMRAYADTCIFLSGSTHHRWMIHI